MKTIKCKCGRSCSSRRGGAHGNPVGTPFASFYPNNWSREKKKQRKEKNEFLWFIYDAMKACWTHQNRQQWSDCQRRWSVFIVEQERERAREEQSLRLCCGRVLTISLPRTPKLQTTRPTISCLINISQSNMCPENSTTVTDTIDKCR